MVFIPKLQEIKQRREELDVSQRQLAKLCNIRPSFLNMIENAKAKPSYDVLVEIFKVLDEQAEKNIVNLKTASKICTKEVQTVRRSTTLEEVISIMKDKDYSQIPVVDASGCLGMVTENSILNYQLKNGKDSISKAKAIHAMEVAPPIIDWDQPITQRILDLLYDARCLLVSRDGKVKGIIAKIDAIKESKK